MMVQNAFFYGRGSHIAAEDDVESRVWSSSELMKFCKNYFSLM